MTIKTPKRIDTNLMRLRLGDAETERILMKLAVPMMPRHKIKPEEYLQTLQLLDAPNPSKGMRLPLVFRQWFAERPRNMSVFKAWLQDQIKANGNATPVATPAPVRRRKRNRGGKVGRPRKAAA